MEPVPLDVGLILRSGEAPRGGSGLIDGDEVAPNSLETSGRLIPKFGVLVEIGMLGDVRFCGDRSSSDGAEDGLKFADGMLASGGKALADEAFALGSPEGMSRGAGWSDGAVEFGKVIGGTAGSVPAIVAGGKALGDGLEPKPFDGELLNMSNALDAFPAGVDPMGLGPDTSGNVSSCPSSNSALSGVSVPFMAT